jgi:hypothetical protein
MAQVLAEWGRGVVRFGLTSALAVIGALAHAEPQSGSYFCAAEAAAGLKYDASLGKWTGAMLRPDSRFTLRLVFNRSYTRKFSYTEEQVDEYRADITPYNSGNPGNPLPCLTVTETDAENLVAMVNGSFGCSTMVQRYEFNIGKNRYLNTYDFGYINGASDDMPTITGGTCVKIDPGEPTATGTVAPRR